MPRKTWILIAQIAAVALVLVGVVMVVRYLFVSDDDDRPPIIVQNGSMTFDDGDPAKPARWKPWAKPDPQDAKRWRPLHANGADVAAFSVDVAGSTDQGCSSTTTASAVTLDYTLTAGGSVRQVKVERVQVFSTPGHVKWEPWVTAPAAMSIALNPPSAPPAPPRIIFNPGDGWISKATLSTSSGDVTCAFKQPDTPADRQAVKITIKPTK